MQGRGQNLSPASFLVSLSSGPRMLPEVFKVEKPCYIFNKGQIFRKKNGYFLVTDYIQVKLPPTPLGRDRHGWGFREM